MIQAESDNVKRDEYLKRLMSLPNQVCSRLWHVLLLSVYIYILNIRGICKTSPLL
jgi:hypothetical protein